MNKILYILPSYNLYGGTPKKTLDLMKYFGEQSSLYVYEDAYSEFKPQFEATGGKVYEGFFGRNIYKHLRVLLLIIDRENIDIVQTQFSMGETLGFLIKLFRPQVKLVVAFVSGIKPTLLKSIIVNQFYKKADAFVYITNYVKTEKGRQFSILNKKPSEIIFNGTEKRLNNGLETVKMQSFSLLDIAGLIDLKNIQVLIEALNIVINMRGREDIFLYVAGDGPQRGDLEALIFKYSMQRHVFLLGYQSNVGSLINDCDVFVHPAYKEGFGIAVAEAMMAEKPIIVAKAGGLPELIEHEKSGLVVDPFDAQQWAVAIVQLIENKDYGQYLARNAKIKAETEFSVEKFSKNYNYLYESLI